MASKPKLHHLKPTRRGPVLQIYKWLFRHQWQQLLGRVEGVFVALKTKPTLQMYEMHNYQYLLYLYTIHIHETDYTFQKLNQIYLYLIRYIGTASISFLLLN